MTLIHFEFFLQGERKLHKFILLIMDISLPTTFYWQDYLSVLILFEVQDDLYTRNFILFTDFQLFQCHRIWLLMNCVFLQSSIALFVHISCLLF